MIRVDLHPCKGRIAVAAQEIKRGEVIEVAHGVEADADALDCVGGISDHYWLHHGMAVVLFGRVQMCNHSWSPNATVEIVIADRGPVGTLTATADIAQGEEISISYRNIWFDVV